MKFEKRSAGGGEEPISPPPSSGKRQPVVVYIMILFIAAFLLMALSFFMHQRSNTEAFGQLQSSFNTIQAAQEAQERIIALQDELAQAREALDRMEDESREDAATIKDQQGQLNALTNLYLLDQAYHSEDYEGCLAIISAMERSGQVAYLTLDTDNQALVLPAFYNSPRTRFDHLKEAVNARIAEAEG